MIHASSIGLKMEGRSLFNRVDIHFSAGNRYALSGTDSEEKTIFLRLLSGEITPDSGEVILTEGQGLAVFDLNANRYDGCDAMRTVLLGKPELVQITDEMELLYAKEMLVGEEQLRLCELEKAFAEMDGSSAESDAEYLLSSLRVTEYDHHVPMAELPTETKAKVLLAQAAFSNAAVLLLDEPTKHLDKEALAWLEEFLQAYEGCAIIASSHRRFIDHVCTHSADIAYSLVLPLSETAKDELPLAQYTLSPGYAVSFSSLYWIFRLAAANWFERCIFYCSLPLLSIFSLSKVNYAFYEDHFSEQLVRSKQPALHHYEDIVTLCETKAAFLIGFEKQSTSILFLPKKALPQGHESFVRRHLEEKTGKFFSKL